MSDDDGGALIPDFFNVFTTAYEAMSVETFESGRAEARVIHESPDGRVIAVASRYPDGMTFRYGASVDYHEVFYVAQGHGSRTYADGTSVPMATGDLIYVAPGVDIDYVYSSGFLDIAFFWSQDGVLPRDSLIGGLEKGRA